VAAIPMAVIDGLECIGVTPERRRVAIGLMTSKWTQNPESCVASVRDDDDVPT
jgi:hypothetical protein